MGPSVHPRHLHNLSETKDHWPAPQFCSQGCGDSSAVGRDFLAGVIFSTNDEVGIGNGDPWFTPPSSRC